MSKIRIEGHEINLEDIVSIEKIGRGSSGFDIRLFNGKKIRITEYETYEMSDPNRIRAIKDRYHDLYLRVKSEWERKKDTIPTFNL